MKTYLNALDPKMTNDLIFPDQNEHWILVSEQINANFQNWRRRRLMLQHLKLDNLGLLRRYPPHIWEKITNDLLPSIMYDQWNTVRVLAQEIEMEHSVWTIHQKLK